MRPSPWRILRAIALLVVPVLIVGPALLPGRLLLPLHPAAFEPLASEDPGRAELARAGQNPLASDGLFPFVTDRLAMREAIEAGDFPLWDPLLGVGQPLAAGSLVPPWYPLNWLELLLGERGRAWHALASLFLGGLGMALFLGARGHSRPAVLYGAVSFQAAAWATVNLHLGMKVDAAAALPWCLWSVEGLLRGRPSSRAGLSIAVAAALGAGFPAIGVFVATTSVVWLLARWSRRPDARPAMARARSAAALLLPVGVGLLGAAVVLLPTWEASTLSARSPLPAQAVAVERLPTAAASTLLLPNLFGAPQDELLAPNNPLAWWLLDESERDLALVANALEWNLSPGLATLLLAVAGLVAAPRRALLPGLVLLGVLGFVFAWPLFRLAYHLPGFDLGAPGRAYSVAWTLWPVLAAVGIDALILGRRRAWLTIVFFAGLAGALGLGLASTGAPGRLAEKLEADLAKRYEMSTEQVREWLPCASGVRGVQRLQSEGRWLALLALLGALAAGASRWAGRRAGSTLPLSLILLPWCALSGLEAVRLARQHLQPREVPGPLFPPSEAIEAIRGAAGSGRVLRLDRSASGVGDVLRLARPNLLRGYGIADATPYVVFPSRDLARAFRAVDPASAYSAGFSRLSDPQRLDQPLLDLAGVTCILSRDPIEHERWTSVLAREGFHVYRRAEADPGLARAFLAPADPGLADSAGRAVDTHRPGPNGLDARLSEEAQGGWVVFREGWAPGWKASVDGSPAPVERVLGFARGVPVPAGAVAVRTRYEPWSLRIGACLTLLAAGVVAHWLRADRRRQRLSSARALPDPLER